MFLKKTSRLGKTYLSIVESYWEDGQSKHRTYASLGTLENFDKDHLAIIGQKLIDLAERKTKTSLQDISQMEQSGCVNWGAHQIFAKLWQMFELDRLIQTLCRSSKVQYDVVSSIFNVVLMRLMQPASKLKSHQLQNKYLGLAQVDLHHIYRCLDFLSNHKNEIERNLFLKNRNIFNMAIDIVFYDVTTLYFESVKPNELKEFGYSKDAKFGEVQVVVGLLIDKEGRPVGYDVFPGNTFEGHTLIEALEKLKGRFQIDKIIIVADRGINAKINLKSIKDAGYDYIVGSRLRTLSKKVQEQVLNLQSYETKKAEESVALYKTKKIAYENVLRIKTEGSKHHQMIRLPEKLVCSWSAKRAKKDRKDRMRLIEKAHKMLENSGTIDNKRGAKRYIKNETDKKYSLDVQKIQEDEIWDGIYGIQSSKLELSEEEVTGAYKTLWRIEEAFRVLKSNLETRPVFHWTAKRIKGHLMSCFIAFLLERTLEIKLRQAKIPYSTKKIREAIAEMKLTVIELNKETYYLRSPINTLGRNILRILKISQPKTICGSEELGDSFGQKRAKNTPTPRAAMES